MRVSSLLAVQNKLPQERVKEIVLDSVDIEKEFIIDALPCALVSCMDFEQYTRLFILPSPPETYTHRVCSNPRLHLGMFACRLA